MKNMVTGQREEPQRTRSRRRADRRGLFPALAASALAHILLIVLYPFFSGPYPTRLLAPYQLPVREAEGMRVVRIVEVATPEADEPGNPVDMEQVVEPEVDTEVPGFEEELRIRPRDLYPYPPAWERLRLGQGDPRLWHPIDPALGAPTPDQILRLEIAAAIAAGNDSAAAEAERARQALDWTHTDEDGRRWGVSPGKIHLGDLTIPLPFGFGPPPDYTGDRAEWAFRMADIKRAASTGAVRQSWQDRRAAMKKRREELRALKEQGKKEKEKKKKDLELKIVRPDTISSRPGRR